MSRPAKMPLATALAELPLWQASGLKEAISRTFVFKDFSQAFGFMTQIALAAERMDHHPEWFNVYNRVEVVLTTHDAGGVTGLDLELAQLMDRLAASHLPN
jgi:4a-hydroxytetrahydrobiopterin dehydratase